MNSLQPSWEANEEEAADGGQSAFMRLFGAIEMAYIYIYKYIQLRDVHRTPIIYIYIYEDRTNNIYIWVVWVRPPWLEMTKGLLT